MLLIQNQKQNAQQCAIAQDDSFFSPANMRLHEKKTGGTF
jgi:hypothetical protein